MQRYRPVRKEHKTRVAIYARVSTSDQNNALQVGELENYARTRHWTIEQVEQDRISGAKTDRRGLTAILDAARARRIDVVLVWKLDRFGRSVKDLLLNIQILESAGVRFIATTQGIDTDQSNPVSRFTLTILSAVAELEREFIRERTSAGVEKYKRDLEAGKAQSRSGKNLPPHRPKRIFDRDEVVRLHDSGMSLRKIAAKVGIGEGTVHRTLQERSKRSTELSKRRSGSETANLGQNPPATT